MDPTSLPSEITAIILKYLADENNIAQYATVCREWQAVIEQLNFHSLSLAAQDVPKLNNIMATRNLNLVKYIWYSIELKSYDCSDCFRDDDELESTAVAIKDGIRTMFQTLSKRSHNRGLTLDISIHSPSDAEHYFNYIRFEPANAVGRDRTTGQGSDHVAVRGVVPSLQAIRRISAEFFFIDFDASGHETSASGEEFWASVPQVSCVSRLLLRRQTRRQWDPIAISRLIARLSNLEDLVIEPWSDATHYNQSLTDKRWADLVFPSLIPNNLKRMTIFEDFNEAYDPRNRALAHQRLVVHPVFGALAEASLGLQHLSVAFMTDAKLFWSVRKDRVWERLKTLALTAQDFTLDNDPKKIGHVICLAADAVKKMPKLQTMELWNGGKGHAALFRYSINKDCRQAKILWRANWPFTLDGPIAKKWQDVADANNVSHLKIEHQVLPPFLIRSHGEAILILDLEIEVACPVSIQQIHREYLEMRNL
ncbi:hypothetical protein DM02DRAFT_521358 [Periconia macrospinosa]|uniref:F-box domain-containing protein n=1 Tax=Periconia macrospinosa TaxID=97972 RepID=A0A2V1E0N2_9PLEO|nr:hypothetical protein DM02DRAFT_521358 [Periconia macrospinosa]